MATIVASKARKLAILGGTPVTTSLQSPAWPPVDEKTAKALAELYLGRNWSFNGPIEQDFSAKYAAYHGAKHGVSMVNGTVTLEGALTALGVGKGDEVIVPGLTWMATALATYYTGAKVVFVDIEPTTLCLDPSKIEAAITPKTRAIIPVHLYGSMADIEAINRIARKHKLAVVEDCAHGQGGMWNGRGLGSWGDIGSFSFQQSKTLASGEGGICITSDAELADKLYRFKHIGYKSGMAQGKATQGPPPGLVCHNYRATEFQALILRSQLQGLPKLMKRYNQNADRLTSSIESLEGVRVQAKGRLATQQNYYGFVTIWDGPNLADIPMARILKALAAEGMGMSSTYGPVYTHQLFNLRKNEFTMPKEGCPVTDTIATQRVASFIHYWLGADAKTINTIAQIIAKVASNVDALRGMSE